MFVYEIGPEINQEVHYSGSTLPMAREIYPAHFPPGIINRIGELAILTDHEETDIILDAFGPLEA